MPCWQRGAGPQRDCCTSGKGSCRPFPVAEAEQKTDATEPILAANTVMRVSAGPTATCFSGSRHLHASTAAAHAVCDTALPRPSRHRSIAGLPPEIGMRAHVGCPRRRFDARHRRTCVCARGRLCRGDLNVRRSDAASWTSQDEDGCAKGEASADPSLTLYGDARTTLRH